MQGEMSLALVWCTLGISDHTEMNMIYSTKSDRSILG